MTAARKAHFSELSPIPEKDRTIDARKLLTAIGTGITTFLLIAVPVIELLDWSSPRLSVSLSDCSWELSCLSDCGSVKTS